MNPTPSLLTATRLLEQTMPTTSRRILVYAAITLGLVFAVLIGAGTFVGIASFSDDPGFWGRIGAVVGLVTGIYLVHSFRVLRYFRLDLPHTTAMAIRAAGEPLSPGKAQFEQVSRQVADSLGDAESAFGRRRQLLDLLAEAALQQRAIAILRHLPPALRTRIHDLLWWHSADAILAEAVRRRAPAACGLGVAAFGSHFPQVLRQTLIGKAFLYGLWLGAFLLLLRPVAWVDAALPTALGIWNYVFAAILTYWVKGAFLDPIVSGLLLLTLQPRLDEIDDDTLNAWRQKLPALAQLPE